MVDSVITLEQISKVFEVGKTKITCLENIDLTIKRGSFNIIMGPSGSGKSTLLNLIAGLDEPTTGEIFLDGTNISKLKEEEKVDIRRFQIGFVFQFFYLHPILTVFENVELPMLFSSQPLSSRREKIKNLLKLVGLEHRSDHKPHELSGGEQQRVGIARALANDPPIILADEPTGNLDSKTATHIIDILSSLNNPPFNKTIVMVTHDSDLLLPNMRILDLHDGKIIGDKIIEKNLEIQS
ncbi:MAG: ABC transporter ATP-binding protein [Candidatus Thorarchaeota archaeon]